MRFINRDRRRNDNEPAAEEKFRFPPWLITYSDLITLLLTFFILLMSMADLDPVRFDAASNSLKGAFGIKPAHDGTINTSEIVPKPPIIAVPHQNTRLLHTLRENLDLQVEELEITGQASVMQTSPETILVRIERSLLFNYGQDKLDEESLAFLDQIAATVSHYPIDIRIEGHGDPGETPAAAESAWDLSTARAIEVLRYFIEDGRVDIDRLSAVGYGSTRPVSSSREPESRVMHSRVDLFLRADLNPGTGSAKKDRGNVPL